MLGPGFYHADLHRGNLRVSRDAQGVTMNILDYGMTGQLDPTLQARFLAFGVAMKAGDPDLMARVLWELSIKSENSLSREDLREVLMREIAENVRLGRRDRPFYEWAAIAPFIETTPASAPIPSDVSNVSLGLSCSDLFATP